MRWHACVTFSTPRALETSLTVGVTWCSLAVAPGSRLESPLPAGPASLQLPHILICWPRGSIMLPMCVWGASGEPLCAHLQPPYHSCKQEELLYTSRSPLLPFPLLSSASHARQRFTGLYLPVATPPCVVRYPTEMNSLLFCSHCLTPAPCPLSLS